MRKQPVTLPFPSVVSTTLTQLVYRYLAFRTKAGELRPTSVKSIRYGLLHFCRATGAGLPADQLSDRHVELWLAETGMGPATARARLSQVRMWCRWMIRAGIITQDPTLGIRGPRQPRYLPRGLRKPAVSATISGAPDLRAHLILLLMVQEGLRCCEVADLQVADVDPLEGAMLVRGKGGHQRVLPISDETQLAIEAYVPARRTAGPLIRSRREPTQGISAGYISSLVSEWIHSAGIDATAHALRHTAATDMLRSGAHLRDVQTALGHVSIETTQRYLPWVVGDLRVAMGGRRYGYSAPSGAQAVG